MQGLGFGMPGFGLQVVEVGPEGVAVLGFQAFGVWDVDGFGFRV